MVADRRHDAGRRRPPADHADRHGWTTAPNPSKAAKIPGWVSIAGLPPPPRRRTRVLDMTAPECRSDRPRSIVPRAIAVANETATTPPRPAPRASPAENNRRPFSSRGRADGSNIYRPVKIDAPTAASSKFPDSFVAFSPASRFFAFDSVVQAQTLSECLCRRSIVSQIRMTGGQRRGGGAG
jgi:hypothetical protein